MGKKDKNVTNLGKSLIRDRFAGIRNHGSRGDNSLIHTSDLNDGYDWGRLNLQSVTEESSFQQFLSTAQLAGTEFEAEKLNVKFVKLSTSIDVPSRSLDEIEEKHTAMMKIPRRPAWDSETTPAELEIKERELFLKWRRQLAVLQEQEGFLLTPYEKNLEFWRQLWRVIERSDIVVQIVDARNPLLFRCEDLEKYVLEVNKDKQNVLLINKSDFLNAEQRKIWAEYFDKEKIRVIFYSAITMSDNASETSINELMEELNLHPSGLIKNSHKLFTNEELINFFKIYHRAPRVVENKITVGLVGYPNVGKSSTLNSLLSCKKVAVSATPGKTKHFQTFNLSEDLILCDCPGLVMPNFASSRSEMILYGILPIDQMRDHVPPVTLLTSLIPRHILEEKYSIILPKSSEGDDTNRSPTSEELLNAFGYTRGFMTQNGQPDNPRSARYILKDFVSGKLLYCYAPPGFDQNLYHPFLKNSKERSLENADPKYIRAINAVRTTTQDIDRVFFRSNRAQVHERGLKKIMSYSTLSDKDAKAIVENHSGSKPWKQHNKHANKKKREKLRRTYAELDQH